MDLKSLIAIHLGYSEISEGYRLFDVKFEKLFISKDVFYNEGQKWDWEKGIIEVLNKASFLDENAQVEDIELVDIEDGNSVIRGTRTLQDIYNRCNVGVAESTSFTNAY